MERKTAARETAARETAARETAARETAARETAARETAALKAKGVALKVFGAGSAEMNGYYKREGEINGKPHFRKLNANFEIDTHYQISIFWIHHPYDASSWIFYADDAWTASVPYDVYNTQSDTPLPPLSGWGQCGRGEAPCPTLVFL